jgi:hypothetical protein
LCIFQQVCIIVLCQIVREWGSHLVGADIQKTVD